MGKFVHGLKKTRRYEIWCGMKKRCNNKNSPRYKDYGGRGIFVCGIWKDNFQEFYNWSELNGYRNDLVIDRINNDGDYEPTNCRWVTNIVNCNNGRHNKKYFHNGVELTLREWSWATGIKYKTLKSRIDLGWDIKDVLTVKVGSRQGEHSRQCQECGKFLRKHQIRYCSECYHIY